jgi:hypothetical protein
MAMAPPRKFGDIFLIMATSVHLRGLCCSSHGTKENRHA